MKYVALYRVGGINGSDCTAHFSSEDQFKAFFYLDDDIKWAILVECTTGNLIVQVSKP